MNEDSTRDLPEQSFQQRVLAEFAALRGEVTEMRAQQAAMAKNIAALDQRLTSLDEKVVHLEEKVVHLEEKVDARLKETRPIWEAVRGQIEKLDEKFNLFIRDLYDTRGDVALHDKRLGVLERRVLS